MIENSLIPGRLGECSLVNGTQNVRIRTAYVF